MPFRTGEASAHYGQHVEDRTGAPYPTARERRHLRARSVLGRPPRVPEAARGSIWVPAVALAELLTPYPNVDLLDVDIQGAELPVLAAAMHRLDTQVRRVHVGTHGTEIERGLRQLFKDHGWECAHDYPGQSVTETRYGPIHFVDGVQSWVNADVDRQEAPSSAASLVRASEAERLKARVRTLKRKVASLKAERDELRASLEPKSPISGEE